MHPLAPGEHVACTLTNDHSNPAHLSDRPGSHVPYSTVTVDRTHHIIINPSAAQTKKVLHSALQGTTCTTLQTISGAFTRALAERHFGKVNDDDETANAGVVVQSGMKGR